MILRLLFFIALCAVRPAAAQAPSLPSYEQVRAAFERGDYSAAFRGARQRSEWDDKRVHYFLGRMFREGWGTDPDKQQAYSYYLSAADQGDVRGTHGLGEMYWHGELVARNPERACDYFAQAASRSLASAQRDFARCELTGQGRPRDLAAGTVWLHRAAAQDDLEALRRLRELYASGNAPPASTPDTLGAARRALAGGQPREAERLARQALASGAVAAHGVVGAVLRDAAAASRKLARLHLEIAAAAGDALGIYHLALEDYARQKVDLLTRPFCDAMQQSMESGFEPAAAWLGECFRRGQGRPTDVAAAKELFERGAEQGVPMAYVGLARLFAAGQGVPQDWAQAGRWAALALRGGATAEDIRQFFAAFDTVRAAEAISRLHATPDGSSATAPVAVPVGASLAVLSFEGEWMEVFAASDQRSGWVPRRQLRESPTLAFGARFARLDRAQVRQRMAARQDFAPYSFTHRQDLYVPVDEAERARLHFAYRSDGSLESFEQETRGVLEPAVWERRQQALRILYGAPLPPDDTEFGRERRRWRDGDGLVLELLYDRVNARLIERYSRVE